MLKKVFGGEAHMAPGKKIHNALLGAGPVASRSGAEEAGVGCKYLQRRRAPHLSAHRSGFSLIEVVIAIGVFLFGALAIVRIFPGAIAVIQTSEQRNVAQRMNQTSLARYTNAPLSVPEAIIDVDPANYTAANETGWTDFAGAVYGTANENESLPREPASPDDISPDNSTPVSTQIANSAAGRFRRVIGEEHVVQREFDGTTPQGVITLRYPYLVPGADVNRQAVHLPIIYSNVRVTGVTTTTRGALDFSNAVANGVSLSDTSPGGDPRRVLRSLRRTGASAPAREAVTFYVSYRWSNAGGPVNGVIDEPKRFPDETDFGPIIPANPQGAPSQVLAARINSASATFGTPAGFSIVPGPVNVRMRQSQALTGQNPLNVNLGRIVVPATLIGQRISVDYTVPDWRSIVHDDNLSTKISTLSTGTGSSDIEYLTDQAYTFGAGTTDVKEPRVTTVPTRFITEDNISPATPPATRTSQVYALIKGTTTISTTPPVQGVVATASQWSPDTDRPAAPAFVTPAAAGGRGLLAVRPKSGQVFYDVVGLSAPSSRVVYRNVDGWLEQPSVAAHTYTPYNNNRASITEPYWPREPWREYVWNTTGDALFFHPSEAGKTVLATYVYEVTPGVRVTMRDVPLTIRGELVAQPTTAEFNGFALPPNATNSVASLAYFVDRDGRCLGTIAATDTNVQSTAGTPTAGARVVSVLGIRGASIRVRSAWFSGGRYSQNEVSGYRSLDVESASRS